jgi:hypothetical protein
MDRDIEDAHKHSDHHRAEVERSATCGCFCCGETFTPSEIERWCDGGQTAICPRCGVDAVLGSESGFVSEGFLTKMRSYWFAF